MSRVPGLRKKLSPIVEPESAGPVRARFSNPIMPRSGLQVILGGWPSAAPGVIWKSTLLSWKPSPETGAAYHQFRSNDPQFQWTICGSKYDPSPMIRPVTRRTPAALMDSAIASTAVHVESQPPDARASIPKQRSDQVGSPRPYSTRSPFNTPSLTVPLANTLVFTR